MVSSVPKKNTIYDATKLAKFFGVTKKTIWSWCKRGKLPGFKIGKEWKVRVADLQKMIDRKVQAPQTNKDRTPQLF